jgi:hypothetical protein
LTTNEEQANDNLGMKFMPKVLLAAQDGAIGCCRRLKNYAAGRVAVKALTI